MSDERIAPEVVRVVGEAIARVRLQWFSPKDGDDFFAGLDAALAEAAIRAADQARGLGVEHSDDMTLWKPDVLAYRYVSDWYPVERPS